jgi:glucan-binding YG repeat protein
MTKTKRCFLLFLLVFAFLLCGNTGAAKVSAATYKNTYVKVNGVYYYYDKNGKLVKGLYKSAAGNLYYFDTKTGAAKAGIFKINGKRYIVNNKGAIQKGWVVYNGKRYYCLPSTCVIQTGWFKSTYNNLYYFWDDGAVRYGMQTISGKKYYLNSYGRVAKNSFVTSGGKKYYMNSSGYITTGWKTISGNRYYFNSKGVMQTGWLKLSSGTYYLGTDGVQKTGWIKLNNKYYCIPKSTGKLFTNGWWNGKYVGKDGYWIRESEYSSKFYSIMGTSQATVDQMVALYEKSGKTYPSAALSKGGASTIRKFCQIILEEANAEGVRAEVVFAQAMKETGWLQFGGDVKVSQYNFAGLGATGGGVSGNSFKNVRTGIRAQVQHLKAYASTESLKNTCVDVRFTYVTRACAPYVEWLGAKENPTGNGWAVPGEDYGYDLCCIIANVLGTTYTRP